MNIKELIKTIENNPIALATATKDGEPHAIVVQFVKVKEGQLFVTDNYMKKTIKNIQENDKISLVVWNSEMKGYKISGFANYFTEGEEYDYVKALEQNINEPCKGVVVITPLNTEEIL